MERVSPTAYLSVLICVFVADLAAIPFLYWQRKRLGSKSELFRQPQIWIMIAKYLLDAALVILMVLDISKGVDDGEGLWLTVDTLLRFSITCVTISEFLLLWGLFARLYCGRFGWWRNLGLVAIAFLTLLKLLPLLFKLRPVLSLNEDIFGFWTVFGAGLLENLVFSVVYWWALCKDRRKWRYRRLTTPILSSTVVLAVSLIMGWRPLSIQRLLVESFLLLITIQSLLHSAFAQYRFVQAQTEGREKGLDEASRSWKPNSGKLSVYIAHGISFSPGDSHLSQRTSPPTGWHPKMTNLDLIGTCRAGGIGSLIYTDVGKEDNAAALMKKCDLENREGNGEGARDVDEDDSETRDVELEMLHDIYKEHRQRKVEREERLLKEGTICRVKAEWCCRCKATTKFVEKNCTQRNCGHTRCRLCNRLDTTG